MESAVTPCRLCQGATTPVFCKKQLGKYLIDYFQCQNCHSLQTQTPTWLDEAYANLNFAKDVGMVERTQFASHLILLLAQKLKFTRDDPLLDFGGGTGLLTRMLRDRGLNAYWCDKYAQNIFALGFEKTLSQLSNPKLLTAFEVFEHLPSPQEELTALLATQPHYLLFSTKLYQNQDATWWYLLEDGQHVQFYSRRALEHLASSHNYFFTTEGSTYHLFSKTPCPSKLLKHCCKKASSYTVPSPWPSRTASDFQNAEVRMQNAKLG